MASSDWSMILSEPIYWYCQSFFFPKKEGLINQSDWLIDKNPGVFPTHRAFFILNIKTTDPSVREGGSHFLLMRGEA